MAPVLGWLARCLPKERAGALLHNDYRLDNCLLDTTDPARIVAVLGWDMCTQGDPLADLGYVLNYWIEHGDDPEWREIASMPTWREGFPSRAEATAATGGALPPASRLGDPWRASRPWTRLRPAASTGEADDGTAS